MRNPGGVVPVYYDDLLAQLTTCLVRMSLIGENHLLRTLYIARTHNKCGLQQKCASARSAQ